MNVLNKKIVLILSILLMVLSLPSVYKKMMIESSSPTVEFTFDYFSLLQLSDKSNNPERFLTESLNTLNNDYSFSLTVPNNNLWVLEQRNLVSVLPSSEFSNLALLSGNSVDVIPHSTYVLFLNNDMTEEIKRLLTLRYDEDELTFSSLNNVEYAMIESPRDKALFSTLPYFEYEIEALANDFPVVLKLDNKWDGKEQIVMNQLKQFDKNKLISKLLPSTSGPLGYEDDYKAFVKDYPSVPLAYLEYFSPSHKQKGFIETASIHDYNIVRLHSLGDNEITKYLTNPNRLVDRINLAVNERNIRMIHFQFPSDTTELNADELFEKTLHIAYKSIEELKDNGFSIGISETFKHYESSIFTLSKWFSLLFGLFIVFYVISFYSHKLSYLFLLLASVLLLTSFFTLTGLIWKVFALLIAISIPLLSVLMLLASIDFKNKINYMYVIKMFLFVSLTTVLLSISLIGMHSGITFSLYLDQFKGISLAHLIPPFIVVFFLFHFYDSMTTKRAITILKQPILIYHVLGFALLGVVAFYYLSRTGNNSVMIPFEAEFRHLLKETLGVRPRTKEFLIAHPLFVIVIYYWHHHKSIKWLLPVAVVGQLSIVNTFTHIHTPTIISLTRSIYGISIGLLLGLIAIFILNGLISYYKKFKLNISNSS